MAWSQAETEFQQLVCTDATIWAKNNDTYSARVDQMSSGLTLLAFLSDGDIRTANYWLIGDENAGIHYLYNNSGATLQFYYNNSHIDWVCASKTYMDNYSANTVMIGLGYDGTSTYKAIVGCKYRLYSRDYVELHIYGGGITAQTVEWVFQNPPISYVWQSVPSISGKNGILTLSTLNDINDGEPVETSDTSKFNLTDDSNVSALVAAHFSE